MDFLALTVNCKTNFTIKTWKKTFRPKSFGLLRFESGKKATAYITVHISRVRGWLTQQNTRTLRETTNIKQVTYICLGSLYVRVFCCVSQPCTRDMWTVMYNVSCCFFATFKPKNPETFRSKRLFSSFDCKCFTIHSQCQKVHDLYYVTSWLQ